MQWADPSWENSSSSSARALMEALKPTFRPFLRLARTVTARNSITKTPPSGGTEPSDAALRRRLAAHRSDLCVGRADYVQAAARIRRRITSSAGFAPAHAPDRSLAASAPHRSRSL